MDPDAPLGDLDFAGDAYGGLRAFLTAVADRDGPIKVSLTGPVTLGVALHAAGLDADLAFAVAGSAVRRRAAALVDHLLQRVPQAELVVFVDEPAMACLTEQGFPIGPTEGVDLVSGALAAVEHLAVTGLHCCAPADYRLLLGTGPRILSIPVDGGIERHAGLLGDHLDRGGWVAWGAVPTDGPVGPTVERLWRRLSRAVVRALGRRLRPGAAAHQRHHHAGVRPRPPRHHPGRAGHGPHQPAGLAAAGPGRRRPSRRRRLTTRPAIAAEGAFVEQKKGCRRASLVCGP